MVVKKQGHILVYKNIVQNDLDLNPAAGKQPCLASSCVAHVKWSATQRTLVSQLHYFITHCDFANQYFKFYIVSA